VISKPAASIAGCNTGWNTCSQASCTMIQPIRTQPAASETARAYGRRASSAAAAASCVPPMITSRAAPGRNQLWKKVLSSHS
jgi:hypothetical protein